MTPLKRDEIVQRSKQESRVDYAKLKSACVLTLLLVSWINQTQIFAEEK